MQTLPTTMHAFQIKAYKQTPALVQAPVPTIGDDDVLVHTAFVAINPLDSKVQQGELKLILPYRMPLTLGNDVAGTVVQVGKNVRQFAIGDEIYARISTSNHGTFAQYVAINQHDIALKPKNLSLADASGLPLVALTAYQALFERLAIKKGQKVLILAGAGGVGSIAIQMAKMAGAYVATTASQAGFELVKSLGADLVIDYKTQDFAQMLTEFDAVLDTQGGDELNKAFGILKAGGKVVSIAGMPTASFAKAFELGFLKACLFGMVSYPIHQKAKRHKVSYEFLFMKSSGKQLSTIADWVETGKVRAVTDKVFELKDIMNAWQYANSGRAKGKVVIDFTGNL